MEDKIWELAAILIAAIISKATDELVEALKKARKKTPAKHGKHARRS